MLTLDAAQFKLFDQEQARDTLGETYTIQKGDTLSGIARGNGTITSDLVTPNDISDPDRIQEGQTLALPAPGLRFTAHALSKRILAARTGSQPRDGAKTRKKPHFKGKG